MSEQQFDPETATLDDLRAMAEAEMRGEVETAETQEQTEETEVEQSDEPDEVVYRREIDLGDGSGVQVFEAPSVEELVDKLAVAQANATRKIRELTSAKKQEAAPELSADEEWVIAQELATKPLEAFEKLFEKKLGRKPAELQKDLDDLAAFRREEAERKSAKEFVDAHPDYVPTPKNGARIEKWLRVEGLAATPENIEKAFQDLSESGLLESKKPETQATETQSGARIVTVSGQRRAASGLSVKRTASAQRTTGPTDEEAYKMPLDKLAELANRELAAQR